MTCASLLLEGYVPETDATIVTRLLDAGAEVVATLNLDNFAFSGAGDTSAFGPVLNPHNTDYLAGGSSGGQRPACTTTTSISPSAATKVGPYGFRHPGAVWSG